MMEVALEAGVLPEPLLGRGRRCACLRPNVNTFYTYAFNLLFALVLLVLFFSIIYVLKDYLKAVLFWVETQNPWLVFFLFVVLFTAVSFPIMIGYLVLIITAGYLLGLLRGLATVLVAANVGVAVAHFVLRAIAKAVPLTSLLRNDTARAMLRVISGPQAFKIVFFARLTPIPFGLQNTIFALGNVSGIQYHIASCIGLFPAQAINVYLGSTLRSMHDVLQESHVTGYIVFAFQITIGISLMIWVVQKARKELTLVLMEADLNHEGGLSSSSSAASLIS